MLDGVKKLEKKLIGGTILSLVLGIILTVYPDSSLKLLTAVIGIGIMILGGALIVDYIRSTKLEKITSISLIGGILFVAIGLYLFINQESLISLITTILGILMIVKGLCKFQAALNLRGISTLWKYNLLVGAIVITLGIVLIINPFNSASTFLRIIGILIILGSVFEIAETINVIKELDKVTDLEFVEKKKLPEEAVEEEKED